MTAVRPCPRVLLDISPVTARPEGRTGLARVALSLSLALAARSDVHISTCAWGSLIASDDFEAVRQEFPTIQGLSPRRSNWADVCTARLREAPRQTAISQRLWKIAGQVTNRLRNPLSGIHMTSFDLAHSTYARFPRVVRRAGMPTLLTVHDVMPLRLPPDMLPPGQVGVTRRILEGIRPADWVACVSEWTRHDFLDATGHRPDQTVVIPNGVDASLFHSHTQPAEVADVRKRFGLASQPYFLTLSSLAPHKNMRFLIDAWVRSGAAKAGGMLVMAGGRTTDASAILRSLGFDTAPHGIVVTGFVGDDDFRRLAAGCQSFLFPSLYEGFGLPVLEAMACGSPVIVSNRTAIPEVVGDAGLLLDPTTGDAWAEAIKRAMESPIRTAAHPASVRQSDGFSWSRSARQYVELYRRMLA